MVAIFHLDSAGVVDLKEQVNAYVKNIYDCNNIHGRFINHEGYEITNPESELDKFSAFLEQYIITVEMDDYDPFKYKPDYMAKSLYDTHDLWFLLLKINNCRDRMEFTGPKYRIIDPSNVSKVIDFLNKCIFSVSRQKIYEYPDLTIKPLNIY